MPSSNTQTLLILSLLKILTMASFLTSCSRFPTTSGIHTHSGIASKNRFVAHSVETTMFHHLIYSNHFFQAQSRDQTIQPLIVMLEGDGRPWRHFHEINTDPTPHNPLMLQLMTRLTMPAIYLGRPCYFVASLQNDAFTTTTQCEPKWWTSHRYSLTIIDSLIGALKQLSQRHNPIYLVGHSGGGTLAMLMADRIKNQSTPSTDPFRSKQIRVITLAGNLDSDEWTSHHQYSPLTGSLNPANIDNLASIWQQHYYSPADKNIPPALIESLCIKHKLACYPIDNTSHTQGWIRHWPLIEERAFAQDEK